MTDPSARPLISIVTVCLNARAYIEQTMGSVLSQKADDVEYVVIDGGSTDGTLDVVRSHARDLAYWVSEPDRGIGDAMNKGIAASTGDLIGLLHAGDWYEPGALDLIRHRRESGNPLTIYHGDMTYHHPDGSRAFDVRPALENIWKYMAIHHPTMFVEREVYRRLGGFRLDFHYAMDAEFVHRCLRAGVRFVHVPQTLAHMRLGGITVVHYRRAFADFRDSAILHGAPVVPSYYRYYSATVKRVLLRYRWARGLKRMRDRLLGRPER